MIPLNRTYAPLQAMVDELARCGMTHAVGSPGSRNAPILLALAEDERINTFSVLDERSAGFMALGLAKWSGRAVAVTCTSGTAAANLHPAVIEAREANVPLIVLTADRPPELRDVGAGQAIDQIKLYGDAVKWFVEAGNHDPGRETAVHFRSLACRAWATAVSGRPGPVHINLPLREPLAPVEEALDEGDWEGRADGGPWTAVSPLDDSRDDPRVELVAEQIRNARRGVIVAGDTRERVATAVTSLARAAGWPVLADPLSGVRCGAHDRSRVISHYDVLLRAHEWAAARRPDLVIRVGAMPTSKPLRAWIGDSPQVVIDPYASWNEPTRHARLILAAGAGACSRIAEAIGPRDPAEPWLDEWLAADSIASQEIATESGQFEGTAYSAVARAVPDQTTVWVSSSMPVRDVESFFPSIDTELWFFSNRGANGIDGVVSSALGAAAASEGRTVLLTGELALLHDLGGLVARKRLGIPLTIVCVNNAGGGIFDFLPVAGSADQVSYEELIATPHDVPLATAADLGGLEHVVASTPEEIREAAQPGTLVEVRTDRSDNVTRHRALIERIAGRLEG
jgi:2-succinyl-5-enolpyruvyl-6-hydroxy-3-cyclohexene-1-carboxylate synthase